MNQVLPDYYKEFHCIAQDCKHNCCIGWEIDIDKDSMGYYKTVGGSFGKRLAKCISNDEAPHFLLDNEERCPFLNSQNLCDIITELGEDKLCTICKKHPRFENLLPGRIEMGIGMACEEAARIILSKKEPCRLIPHCESDDEIIILRDRIISALQNREKDIKARICDMLLLCGTSLDFDTPNELYEIFSDLECLDTDWRKLLNLLAENNGKIRFAEFKMFMSPRMYEYEQLAVYLIYRHFANAQSLSEAAARAVFAALGCKLVFTLGALLFSLNNHFTFEEQAELCRMFSAEIEYSDENPYILFDLLQK